jgi:hypothetical protein
MTVKPMNHNYRRRTNGPLRERLLINPPETTNAKVKQVSLSI